MINQNVSKMSAFKWNQKNSQAAFLLAQGNTIKETASSLGINERTIYRWKNTDIFTQELDRLTCMVGIASKAERLSFAQRVGHQIGKASMIKTNKDILDWLKYAQSETDGIKLDLTDFFETYRNAQLAGSRPDGVDEEIRQDRSASGEDPG